MEKKMLKQSLAVWMILILLFVSVTPVALMEDDAAIVPVAEETAGDETVINEENDQLLDESAELVDNVTGEATPVAEEPVVEEPVVEEPVVEEPVVEEPVVEEPVVEEPVVEEPVVEEPVVEEPVVEEPVVEEPVVEEPVVEEPVVEEPVVEEPVVEEPVVEEPVVEEPVVEEPVVEEPVVEESVVEEPVVEEPVVEEPIVEEPVVEEEYTLYIVEEETDLRVKADGLSDILATIPAETEVKAYSFTEKWIKVGYTDPVLGEIEGYIYREPEDTTVKAVEIFSSRRSVMTPGETIYLTSKLYGLEGYTITYQWQCDMGNGFVDVAGANSASYSFTASVETLSYDWRLAVYFE